MSSEEERRAGPAVMSLYVKLVEALCALSKIVHPVNLIKVSDGKKLGKWVGLCRRGKPREVVNCGCVVTKDYGKGHH